MRASYGYFQIQLNILNKAGIEYTLEDLYSIKGSTDIAVQLINYYDQQFQNSPEAKKYNALGFSQKVALLAFAHSRGIEKSFSL